MCQVETQVWGRLIIVWGSPILLSTFLVGQEEVVASGLKFDSENIPTNLDWTFHLAEMWNKSEHIPRCLSRLVRVCVCVTVNLIKSCINTSEGRQRPSGNCGAPQAGTIRHTPPRQLGTGESPGKQRRLVTHTHRYLSRTNQVCFLCLTWPLVHSNRIFII